jgi:hypothetical protein
MLPRLVVLMLFLALTGCAAYRTPGAGAPLSELAASGTGGGAGESRRPAVVFPARIALVRVQSAEYAATDPACHGTGRYCVMTVRNIESAREVRRLQQLPRVAAVDNLSPERVPSSLNTVDALRQAAGENADLLLLYTLDTRFTIDGAEYGQLAEIKPGFLPNRDARVTAKTAAALIDVHSGYVYGKLEAVSWTDQNAAMWATRTAIEDERRMTERASFELFVNKFASLWQDVVATYGAGNQ